MHLSEGQLPEVSSPWGKAVPMHDSGQMWQGGLKCQQGTGNLLQGARGPSDTAGGWHMPNRTAVVLTTVSESSVGGSVAAASPRTTASLLCLSFSIFSFAFLRTFSYFSFPEGKKHPQIGWAQHHSHLS